MFHFLKFDIPYFRLLPIGEVLWYINIYCIPLSILFYFSLSSKRKGFVVGGNPKFSKIHYAQKDRLFNSVKKIQNLFEKDEANNKFYPVNSLNFLRTLFHLY